MPHFDTAANVISNAGLELGLLDGPLANPFASTDQNIIQLCALTTRVGRNLVRARDWTHLTLEYTFDTVNNVSLYSLPDDFERVKNQTQWNRSTRQPVGPAMSSQGWQAAQAHTATGRVSVPFRIQQNQFFFQVAPSSAEHIYYEYVSQYWVEPTGAGQPGYTLTTLPTDVLWFDEPLMVSGLKLAFLRAKNRDTTSAQEEFDEAYRAAAGGDGAAPVIVIADGGGGGFLGPDNLPDSGYGS